MYVRTINVNIRSGKMDEAIHIVEELIAPVLKEQKGFKGQLFLAKHDTGKAIYINLWKTKDDLIAFESSSLYSGLMGKIARVLSAKPSVESYEVGVLELQ